MTRCRVPSKSADLVRKPSCRENATDTPDKQGISKDRRVPHNGLQLVAGRLYGVQLTALSMARPLVEGTDFRAGVAQGVAEARHRADLEAVGLTPKVPTFQEDFHIVFHDRSFAAPDPQGRRSDCVFKANPAEPVHGDPWLPVLTFMAKDTREGA